MSPVKLIKSRLIQCPFILLRMHQTTSPWEMNAAKGPFPLQGENHHLQHPCLETSVQNVFQTAGWQTEWLMKGMCELNTSPMQIVKRLVHNHARKHLASGYAVGIRSKSAGSHKNISIHKQVDLYSDVTYMQGTSVTPQQQWTQALTITQQSCSSGCHSSCASAALTVSHHGSAPSLPSSLELYINSKSANQQLSFAVFSCTALENILLFSSRYLITSWTDDCLCVRGYCSSYH